MEVRQIDISEIKNPKRAELLNLHIIHHAGHRGDRNFIGLKTSKSPDRSLIHPDPAPSSFSLLIKRALTNHHAGTAGVVLEPPTQDKPLFPPQIFPGRPAPNHLNAGRIGADSTNSTLLEPQSAPDSPAPTYCIHNGTPIPVDADRAGKAELYSQQRPVIGQRMVDGLGQAVLTKPESEGVVNPPEPSGVRSQKQVGQSVKDAPAPDSQTSNHHNAGEHHDQRTRTELDGEANHVARLSSERQIGTPRSESNHNAGATEMGCTRLFPPPREQISPVLTRSPAPSENARAQDLPRSPEVPDPGVPFTLKSVLNGLLDRLLQHSAYKNPNLIRTNYGWQRREDFEKDQH